MLASEARPQDANIKWWQKLFPQININITNNNNCNTKKPNGRIKLCGLEFQNKLKIKGDIRMLGLHLTKKVRYTLQPVDADGDPATVQPGSVVVNSSDLSVFLVEQDPTNELSGYIVSTGVGTGQFDFSADADLGSGVVTINGFSAVEVLPESAVGFGITFGVEEPITP